jgi:hypothetical protein
MQDSSMIRQYVTPLRCFALPNSSRQKNESTKFMDFAELMERLGLHIPNTQQLSDQARKNINYGIRLTRDPAPMVKDTDPTFEKQIFCAVTFATMKQTKSLKILLYIAESSRTPELPSWIQDFFHDSPLWVPFRLEGCKASRMTKCSPELGHNGTTLKLRGIYIGSVARILPGYLKDWAEYKSPSSEEVLPGSVREWYVRLIQKWLIFALPPLALSWDESSLCGHFFQAINPMLDVWPEGVKVSEKEARILFFRSMWLDPSATTTINSNPDFGQSFDSDSSRALQEIDADPVQRRFLTAFIAKMEYYTAFMDSTGRFGIVLSRVSSCRDYEVVLFEGSPAPFIASKSTGGCSLVAPASISGVMEGEAWPDDERSLCDFGII